MNPWVAKAIVLVSSIVMIVIRAPHGQRSRGMNVVNKETTSIPGGGFHFSACGSS